ncbi:MAG: SprT-like domain-containing protein [Patescibacteria group bacterium]
MNLQSAEILALRLFAQHDLSHWNFKFDRAKRRFGCCNFSTRTISLSKILTELNAPEKVRDTLLHEIAHALVGPRHGHDSLWKKQVRALGGRPAARFRETEVTVPRSKFVAFCPHCQKTFPTFRTRKNVACRACCREFNRGKFSRKFLLEFKSADAQRAR